MKQEYRFGAHIGTSSLLLIFLTLSLVSFGALSLAGAKADERLSEKLREHTEEYYDANHEAEAFVAQTDAKLRTLYAESNDARAFFARAASIDAVASIPMNDAQMLVVSLEFVYPPKTNVDDATAPAKLYRIAGWRVETRDDASYERHLPVSGSGGLHP